MKILLSSVHLLLILFVKSQNTTSILISPDLKVDFPCRPGYTGFDNTKQYLCEHNGQIYCVTSEPFPISYKGVGIEEANAKFYPSFTQRLIAGKEVKSLVEKDTLFENHKCRELIFTQLHIAKHHGNETIIFDTPKETQDFYDKIIEIKEGPRNKHQRYS